MPTAYPELVEQTARYKYWRAADGTYFATSITTILPPVVERGGYYRLDSLKKLKGDI